jgi:hypothetical protein
MLQGAINAVTELLESIPQDDKAWEEKAKVLCVFAEEISKDTLHAAGLHEDQGDNWWYNALARTFNEGDIDDDIPSDCFLELWLTNAPATLTANGAYSLQPEIKLFFGKGRVLDWNSKTRKPNRIMSYENAARLVIFWLMEKILKILRKNQWDRVNGDVEIFDHLAQLLK